MTEPSGRNSPLKDVRDLILKPVATDRVASRKVRDALLGMGKEGDFGRLGEAAEWLALWQRRFPPRIEKAVLAIFAGAHGIATSGVSLSSDDDTRNHIEALRQGRAPLSAIAAGVGANVRVFELALERPTPNIAQYPAMTERECAATIAFGFEAVEDNPDLLAIAVSGAGVGTVAAAVACALYGGSPEYWVRPSAQTPVELSRMRIEMVSAALKRHRGHLSDPLDSLCCLGGREIAACVGAIIAARHQGIPVLLDGFATTIAAGVVHAVSAEAVSHCLASHITERPAHEAALERIGLPPLVQLGFQTGSGLGSATAIGLLKTACAPFIARPADA